MKAALNFRLPEDDFDFNCALCGRDAVFVLRDIERHCRSILKHQDPPPEVREVVEAVRQMIPERILETLG